MQRLHLSSAHARTGLFVTAVFFTSTAIHAQSPALPDAPAPTADVLLAGNLDPPAPLRIQQSSSSLAIHQDRQNPTPPSLSDLGLSPAQTKADPDAQARLDRRTHLLKIHQTLGLVTLAPLAAACITSGLAPPDPRNGQGGNTTGRDIHISLGGLSVAMYGATAFYAIRAPRIPDAGPTRGGIKWHKYLIWIHGPGMVLTPILGAMAYNQGADGQRVHGIASAHAAVALTTLGAYGAAIFAVSYPIHFSHKSSQP